MDIIDTYHIAIIPTILGNGIKLFDNQAAENKSQLISTHCCKGISKLVYK